MTRRERMARRLEKREDWAEGAKADASRRFEAADRAVDGIPPGQPILVGHHSEGHHRRALQRADSNMRRGIEAGERAGRHSGAVATLERRLETSVFSDDADAVEQLEERIAERVAKLDRLKRYNASARKAAKRGAGEHGDASILDEGQRRTLRQVVTACSYQLRPGGGLPAYISANLSGRNASDRKRIEDIKQQQQRTREAEDAGGVRVVIMGDYARVTFAEKPERAVLEELKAAGFRWGSGSWSGYAVQLPARLAGKEETC